MSAKLKQVQFSDIREHFEEIRNWNSRINLNQLTKNEKSPGFEWWALIDGETWVAVAAVDTEGHENAIYGNEVMAKSGNGYGVKLIRALYDEYKSSGKDKFVFDAETNGSLADHYKKNFPDFDISESPWGTPRFTKHYKQQLKMKENSKITLTIGQLRKLIKESNLMNEARGSFANDKEVLLANANKISANLKNYVAKAIAGELGTNKGIAKKLSVTVNGPEDDRIYELADDYEKDPNDIVIAIDVWYEAEEDSELDIRDICYNAIENLKLDKMFASIDADAYELDDYACTIWFYKKSVKEARIDPDSVMDGNEMVQKILGEMKEVGEDAEKIEKMEELIAKFSKKTMEKAIAAKDLRAAARAAVKADCKPLDQAAKQLADMIGADSNVFFSVKMKTERIGVLLTRSADELSYGKIAAKLTDPEFLEEHKKMRKLGKELIALLEKAKEMLGDDALKASWSADLYSQDPDTGDMQHLEEGFMDGIKDAFHKVVDWFGNVFNRLLPRKQEEYAVAAESYDGMLDSLLK
jgi:phosphopantetheinyl transferase (holo-ACP synthase)